VDPFYRSVHPDHDASLEGPAAGDASVGDEDPSLLRFVVTVQYFLPIVLAVAAAILVGHIPPVPTIAALVAAIGFVLTVLRLGVPVEVFAGADV
jgi:hypothetical protein